MSITFSPIAGSFALQAGGIDLEREIPVDVQEAIRDAWIRAGVLVFRGLGHSREAHLRLSRIFGVLEEAANRDLNANDNPHLLVLREDPAKGSKVYVDYRGEERAGFIGWHWDQSFTPRIVRGAVLRMVDKPARGGETGFIDAAGAYDRLPDALKQRIDDLEVVYQYRADFNPISFGEGVVSKVLPKGDDARMRAEFPPSVHPLIITQRETGRKVLKLSPQMCDHILGWDRESSQQLFEELAQYLLDERHAYFHQWEENDMVAWDNWRIIHSARGVPVGESRTVERTTIVGDYELGRYLDPELERDFVARRIVD